MKNFCPGLPIILVGCKKDLRNDSRTIDMLQRHGQTTVTPEQVRRCLALLFMCYDQTHLTFATHFISIRSPFMITRVGRIFGMKGQAVAESIGAHAFYECSARTKEGVEEVFENAVRAALISVKPPKRKKCVIM